MSSVETSLSHTAMCRCWARRTKFPMYLESMSGTSDFVGNS
ncbi:hypothetical protein BSU04_20200 [Caballeronia sordidicola]|uniref:Uncharacterized protein n=1 Tax=Caballeronia sordidicola TaxID=196367 RepID=A0A226X1A5_CABSO|nr:hypothetical protein BSU04_20200 [Caballeronia sordidicola]